MGEEHKKYQWTRRCDLLTRIELSELYHRRRELFLSRWDKAIKAIAVLGASAAVARIASPDVVAYIAAVIAVTSTIGLVGGVADRARKHAELVASFKRLASDIVAKGEHDFEEQDIDTWAARMHMIETDEPPALSALVRLCQNEQAWVRGEKAHIYTIAWYERLLAQYVDFPTRRLEPLFPEAHCTPAK